MSSSSFDLAKDFLGALGPVLIAVPWFAEFASKLRRRRTAELPVSGSLEKLRGEMTSAMDDELRSPKYRDLIWTLAGLGCICASFVISFFVNIGRLPE